jgi:hypothetical protein
MFNDNPETQRIKQIFGKIVNPEMVATLLDSAGKLPLSVSHGPIEFVLAFVSGDTAELVSEQISRVAEIAERGGAIVYDFNGPLVTMAFGTHTLAPALPGKRQSLIKSLHEQMGGNIKMVHGATDGSFGLFGDQNRASFTLLIPQFNAILGTLSRLEFGEIEEYIQ